MSSSKPQPASKRAQEAAPATKRLNGGSTSSASKKNGNKRYGKDAYEVVKDLETNEESTSLRLMRNKSTQGDFLAVALAAYSCYSCSTVGRV